MNKEAFDQGRDPLAHAQRADAVMLTAQAPHDAPDCMGLLQQSLGFEPLALLLLFVSPDADFTAITQRAEVLYPNTDVLACTTAGEIGTNGYEEGMIIAIGFPRDHYLASCLMVQPLSDIDPQTVIDKVVQAGVALRHAREDFENGFAFLMVDGLSLREDMLASSIAAALGGMPFFGGSAGDGERFSETFVALNGEIRQDAGVVAMVRSHHDIRVFSLDHLEPQDRQMVVTEADPDQRIVKEINAEPAAREYARVVGKDPEQLDPFIFASHPVAVRIGDSHHVRAIQRVNDAGELVFFSAIDEGMVLNVAEPANLVTHLDEELTKLSAERNPGAILACDCLLRRIEAGQKQMARDVSGVLNRHGVRGFSTYGEQIGPLHVNHTMTGVAIYPRDAVGTKD